MNKLIKNPFERLQKGVVVILCIVLAGNLSSCAKNDLDFNNIENLYEQPLPVIQKAVQGKWKLQYYYGGFIGTTTIDALDSYMQIDENQIIIGDKNGITTDSPITWEEWENFNGIEIAYLLSYNHQDEVNSLGRPYADRFMMWEIKNGTLSVWDCLMDGFTYSYTKY